MTELPADRTDPRRIRQSRPLARAVLDALLGTCAVAALLALGLGLVRNPSNWPPAEPVPHQGEAVDPARLLAGDYAHAEAALARLIREPQNTWSNLAFVAVGILLLRLPDARLARGAALALIFVGVGSFLYHASASRGLRHLDVAAMYWLYVALVVLGTATLVSRVRVRVERYPWTVGIASAMAGTALAASRNLRILDIKPLNLTNATVVAVSVAVAALLWSARRARSRGYWTAGGAACLLFAAAAVCQVADRPGRWYYDPTYSIQGHTLWHLLSAAATGLLLWLLASAPQAIAAPHPESGESRREPAVPEPAPAPSEEEANQRKVPQRF